MFVHPLFSFDMPFAKPSLLLIAQLFVHYNLDSKNTNFLYIPTATSSRTGNRVRKKLGQPFIRREKNICWDVIQERHSRAARTRQMLLQETKDRLNTQFAIWLRRKLIGQMKKRLSKDAKSRLFENSNHSYVNFFDK